MNLFRHELYMMRNGLVIWILGLLAFSTLFLSFFPSFYDEAEDFRNVLQSYPEEMLRALDVDMSMITSYEGYYAYIFMFILLGFSIQAMNIGIGLLNKEINGGTAEFLLSKPIGRKMILSSKVLAALICLLGTNMVYTAVVYLISPLLAVQKPDTEVLLLFSGAALWLQVFFLTLGLLFSIFAQGINSPVIVSVSVVFSFYVLNMLTSLTEVKGMRYVTPFQYFDMGYIVKHTTYEWKYIGLLAILICCAVCLVYRTFSKKDIKVA